MATQTFKSYVNKNKETIFWQNWVSNHNKEILHLDRAGLTEPDPNYTIFRTVEKADTYVIEYVTSGKGHIESRGNKAEVSEGDVYIIHQRTQHLYYADKEAPFRKKWLNISGTYITSMLSAFKIDGPFFVIHLGDAAEAVFDDIHSKAIKTTSADIDEMATFTMKRLLDLFIMIDNKRRTENDKMPLEEQIVRYIESNICLDISVANLSETFYISSSTMYRMFQKQYGMSPKDFIMKKKIEFAKRMISLGDTNMQMVASTLNFYDSHHFLRTFKKYTGMTPGEFKKQQSE